MDIVVAGIAVAAFAAVVFVLVNAGGHTAPQTVRIVSIPDDGEQLLTLQQAATALELPPSEIVELVERDAIPFFVVRGGTWSNPEHLRFKRAELEEWTIG